MSTRDMSAKALWELAKLLEAAAELAKEMSGQQAEEEGIIFWPPLEEIGKIEMEVRMPNIPEEGP